MGGSLGTIRGQIRLDVASAISSYAAVRAANARTMSAMTDASTRLRKTGLAAVGMGALFLTGFAMAVNAAADFEKKLDYFGAVTNATGEEMAAVRDIALELGATSAFSAGQIADAIVEMGKAGVKAEDITDGMAQAIVNLASAADIDLTQATNIVTSQIQAYSLSAKDAAHVTDVMAGAANASIVDVQDLGVSLKYVGGVAHGLGISFDSTIDALSLLGKAGIKGSTAGTSLRQIMVSLAGGTDKAKGTLEELGIITKDGANQFFTAEGKAKSLAEVFQILQDHTRDLSDKERLMAFRTIFNNRALAAASILTKEGAKGFAEMNSEISKVTAADVARKRLDNLAGDIKKLKGTFETFLIQGGTPFQEFLRRIVQSITKVVQIFGNLPRGVQTGIFAFMLIAGVALTLLGTFALFGAVITSGIGAIRQVAGAFRLLVGIIRILTVATIQQTAAALMNPYVLLAIAVVALIVGLVLLYKRSEKFRAIIDAIGRGIKTGFLAVVEWFKGLPKWFSDRWKEISNAFKVGVDWVKKNWDILLTIITGPIGLIVLIIRRFGDDIVNFFTSLPGKIFNYLKSGWGMIINFFENLPYYIGFAIGFILGLISRFAVMMAAGAAKVGTAVWNGIVWYFTKLPVEIWNWCVQTFNRIVTWGNQMGLKAAEIGIAVYNGVVDFFVKLPGRIWNLLVSAKNRAVQAWNATVTAGRKFGSDTLKAVSDFFAKLPGRVWDFLVSMKNKAVSAWNSTVTAARSFGSNLYRGVNDWLSKLPGLAWSILGRVKQAFLDMVGSAFSAARSFASGLWDGFKSGLGINSPSLIEKQMFQITAVTQDETQKLKRTVGRLQATGRGLAGINFTPWADKDVMARADAMRTAATDAAAMMSGANASMYVGYDVKPSTSTTSSTSRTGSEAVQAKRDITVIVNNPVAERAADSTARKLRQLSDMGAL